MGSTSQRLLAACAGLAAALLTVPAEASDAGIRIAQVRSPARPSAETRQEDQYLDVMRQLRSQCGNAAWSLWHSNSYEAWRRRRSPSISMHYSSGSYPSLPAAPASWPEPLRGRIESTLKRANESLKESGEVFKDLATYINAKDYEDDKFRKGDELNAKLLAAGRACHGLSAEMAAQYVELAPLLIESRKAGAAKPDIVATLMQDWQRTRALSRELARHLDADPAKLDALTKDVTALAEERKAGFEPLKQAADAQLKRFYETILNDDVAVKMRRLLREAKDPKSFASKAEDRPRSPFWSIRDEIDYAMPDTILRYIASAR